MGQLAQKLPYALVHVRETTDDVPPPHDPPSVRVVYLTEKERAAIESELVTVRGVLSESQEDDASHYLDLVRVKDAGTYADAMSFLHELVPDDGSDDAGDLVDDEEDEDDRETTELAVHLDTMGVRGRVVGEEAELTRQAVPGSEEHGSRDVPASEFAGLNIDHVGTGSYGHQRVAVVHGTNGATVFYDERQDEWFSY